MTLKFFVLFYDFLRLTIFVYFNHNWQTNCIFVVISKSDGRNNFVKRFVNYRLRGTRRSPISIKWLFTILTNIGRKFRIWTVAISKKSQNVKKVQKYVQRKKFIFIIIKCSKKVQLNFC